MTDVEKYNDELTSGEKPAADDHSLNLLHVTEGVRDIANSVANTIGSGVRNAYDTVTNGVTERAAQIGDTLRQCLPDLGIVAGIDRISMKLEAAKLHSKVDDAILALGKYKICPSFPEMYAQLPESKTGGFSNEQLQFIKAHCDKDVYKAAQRCNELNGALNLDSNLRLDNNTIPPKQFIDNSEEKGPQKDSSMLARIGDQLPHPVREPLPSAPEPSARPEEPNKPPQIDPLGHPAQTLRS